MKTKIKNVVANKLIQMGMIILSNFERFNESIREDEKSPIVIISTPEKEMLETDTSFIVTVYLPGVEKNDLSVDLTADKLVVYADSEKTGLIQEKFSFLEEVVIGKAEAKFENDVLIVEIPKTSTKPFHPSIKEPSRSKNENLNKLPEDTNSPKDTDEIVITLINGLNDSNKYVRRDAVTNLAKVDDKRVVMPLIGALNDRSFKVRLYAIQALGEVGDQRAVEPLTQIKNMQLDILKGVLLGNQKEVQLQSAAKAALDKLEIKREEELKKQMEKHKNLLNTLKSLYENQKNEEANKLIKEHIIKDLESSYEEIQDNTAIFLSNIGYRAVEPLIEALKSPNEDVRGYAAVILGNIGDPRAVDPLIETLQGPNDCIAHPHANYPEWNFKALTAAALGDIADIRAVEPLLTALNNSDVNIRYAAISALGNIGDRRAIEPILKFVEDENNKVRSIATEILEQQFDMQIFTIDTVERMNREGDVQSLISALFEDNYDVKIISAKSIGEIADFRAIGPLLEFLEDPNEDFRFAITKSLMVIFQNLTEFPDINALELLVKAIIPLKNVLNDPDKEVRINVHGALGALIFALDILGEELNSFNPPESINDELFYNKQVELLNLSFDLVIDCIEPLTNYLQDPDESVRFNSSAAFFACFMFLKDCFDVTNIEPPNKAVEKIIDNLDDPYQNVRLKSVLVLGYLWEIGVLEDSIVVDGLIKALEDSSKSVRAEAAEALGRIGDEKTVWYLIKASEDSYPIVRLEAVKSLGEIGHKRAYKPLLERLDDSDDEVREAAAIALDKLT